MAKRFITTELFKDAWYMDLPNKYKLFWIFLLTDCNHCGVWQVNYKVASFYVGEHLEPSECERILSDRISKINDNKYWFIPKFIEFQYGETLSRKNRAISKVIDGLESDGLLKYIPKIKIIEGTSKPLTSTYQGVKEKEQVKEEVKHKHGEYNHVLLTDAQKEKLITDFGQNGFDGLVKKLDEGIEMKGYKYKNHNLAIRSWAKKDSKESGSGLLGDMV